MLKRILIAMMLAAALVLAACTGSETPEVYAVEDAYKIEIEEIEDAIEEEAIEEEIIEEAAEEVYVPRTEPLVIEFITLPNGTRADTRLSDIEIDLVLRHFAAIEDGDAEAFWDTLGGGQDGVSFNYWRWLVFTYFPEWFIENDPNAGDFITVHEYDPDTGDMVPVFEIDPDTGRLYPRSPLPPTLHGTGLFVREITVLGEDLDYWEWTPRALRTAVVNDYGFERTFILGAGATEWWPEGFIIGHSPGPDFDIMWHPELLIDDFIRRYYPSIFLSPEEQSAISQGFPDNGDPDTLPPGFILLDEPILPFAAHSFRAYDLTVVVSLHVPPPAERRFALTRVYRFDQTVNEFALIAEERFRHIDFFRAPQDRTGRIVVAVTDAGPTRVTDFYYLWWNEFTKEPKQLDVPFDEAREIFDGLTPMEPCRTSR